MEQLLNRNAEHNVTDAIFPINSKEDLQSLHEEITKYDEGELISSVKKIILRGGLAKNLHNLLGNTIIKDFNYDGWQNKESFKSYYNVDTLFFKAAESEVTTFDNYKLTMKKAFKNEKNKMYKDKCLKERNK